MRLRCFLCLLLLCAVICCGLFSVSASAAVVDRYSYNGYICPPLPDYDDTTFKYAFVSDTYVLYLSTEPFFVGEFPGSGLGHSAVIASADLDLLVFHNVDGAWSMSSSEWFDAGSFIGDLPIWSNYDVYDEMSSLYLAASEIEVSQIFPPSVGITDLASMFYPVIDQINVFSVVLILAAGAGCSVGLVFLWWGVRKVTGALIKAFKKGKIRI